jgi:hypothetical protein
MSYDNRNTGILTANERKRDEKDPSHQGSINIDGKEYWLSAWVNTGKEGGKLAGKRYFSIKAKPKLQSDRSSPPTGGQNDPRPSDADPFDDKIPF